MAKLALLFSGQVRNISPILFNRSLRLFIGNNEADIFISYWGMGGRSGAHDENLIQNNQDSSFNVESYIDIAFRGLTIKKRYLVTDNEWKDAVSPEVVNIIKNKRYSKLTLNSAKQLFQIHKSFSLLDTPSSYDFVIRCRFDSIFIFPFTEINTSKNNFVSNINFGHAYYKNRVYDIFFYSPGYCASKVFCLPWSNFSDLVRNNFDNGLDPRDACRIIYLSAFLNNIDILPTRLRYCDVYRNKLRYYFWSIMQQGVSNSNSLSIKIILKYLSNIFYLIKGK